MYGACMGRFTIEIDDGLIAAVMDGFGARTAQEAVDLALRRAVGPRPDRDLLLSRHGTGWDGDLEEMRGPRFTDVFGVGEPGSDDNGGQEEDRPRPA